MSKIEEATRRFLNYSEDDWNALSDYSRQEMIEGGRRFLAVLREPDEAIDVAIKSASFGLNKRHRRAVWQAGIDAIEGEGE